MGKTYNHRYTLTWMPDGRRWRKKNRGKVYYFAVKEGENKTTSYNRCLREWNSQLAKLKAAETADALSEEDKARIAESIRPSFGRGHSKRSTCLASISNRNST